MYKYLKRVLDIVFSFLALVILSPLFLVTAVAVRLDSRGPVIFRQKRLGLDARAFDIYKFRTMCVGAEHMGSGVYSGADDARVTKVGRILRALSIDELPQLVNILRGEMSFIGPRPPLTYHPWPLETYTKEQLHMFAVRPGMTGWAQVHGRKDVEWHKRIQLNCWYVDHVSFWLDIRIFFLTVFQVLKNENNVNVGATLVTGETEDQEAGKV
ncbi:MAG TPA: sugar transferase [Candidatus Scubalenecus merdavium]|uniref:Sugar transferase n=1 Tax=Candidatus Scybalenecus merdavium TaxID=2840939 RepID=A0A9D1MTS1_9FIRM|nr:sugar transferase [Candidatus Scubalenecus merdavium]